MLREMLPLSLVAMAVLATAGAVAAEPALSAFPGAEGFGSTTRAGRGGQVLFLSTSAVFSYKAIYVCYRGLDPTLSYVLALPYASDHVYERVQSLWPIGVELHGPYALHKARAVCSEFAQFGCHALGNRAEGGAECTV